jgi:hypothetical protein
MNAVGNGTAIPEIPCTNDGTKYSVRKYNFQSGRLSVDEISDDRGISSSS